MRSGNQDVKFTDHVRVYDLRVKEYLDEDKINKLINDRKIISVRVLGSSYNLTKGEKGTSGVNLTVLYV